ncbi:MAG: thioesterase family protein [Sneathiella sp.]|uniref:acyl-CoA thioesterase n=1 Tax=Sneathiella sp. TaxID=1964365 RepID=UPI00300368B3
MSGYIESYRGQVLASECDLLGHMNIQFYISRLSHATWNTCYFIGMTPEEIKNGKRALATVQQDSSYLSELMPGDIIHMDTGVLRSSNKTITLSHKLFNSATGDLVFNNVSTVAYMDLELRKAVPLTDVMRQKIVDLSVNEEVTA